MTTNADCENNRKEMWQEMRKLDTRIARLEGKLFVLLICASTLIASTLIVGTIQLKFMQRQLDKIENRVNPLPQKAEVRHATQKADG